MCPCGSKKTYPECCGIFISGQQLPNTPEQLMRSRYTAYSKANIEYIIQTMRGPAAQGFDAIEARRWAKQVKWLKLEVMDARIDHAKGYVEFKVYLIDKLRKKILHEISEFHWENGQWYYVCALQSNLL